MDSLVDQSSKISKSKDIADRFIDEVQNLVLRAIEGDFDAFDEIMLLYRERLYGVIYNMTFNHEDAADLTQESFVKAFRSLSKFKRKSSFFTWLYRIGVNLTLTHLKRKKARKFFSFDQLSDHKKSKEVLAEFSSSEKSETIFF